MLILAEWPGIPVLLKVATKNYDSAFARRGHGTIHGILPGVDVDPCSRLIV